jgi:hypothetical protein
MLKRVEKREEGEREEGGDKNHEIRKARQKNWGKRTKGKLKRA